MLNSAGFLAVIVGLVKLEHRLTKLETTQEILLTGKIMNSDLKNCFNQLHTLIEKTGVVTYRPVSSLINQNPDDAEKMFNIRDFCKYFLSLLEISGGVLSEEDETVKTHCVDYLNSLEKTE